MIKDLLQTLKQKTYTINIRPFELNIIGIRSASSTPNSFDDTIIACYKREDGEWISNQFRATTDPGTFWLNNPMNPQGTAIIKPGQYIGSHRVGVHRGKYQALTQKEIGRAHV